MYTASAQLIYLVDISNTGLDNPPSLASIPHMSSASYQSSGVARRAGGAQSDHILKVSSRPYFTSSSDQEEIDHPNQPVRSLVGAFEDIGTSSRQLTRPLTIHVDSFSSDPFAHTAITTAITPPLKRSQSLQVFEQTPETTPSKKTDKRFNIKTVSANAAQRFLKPYWKIKMDNAKQLIHSFSSATVSSKDPS